MSIRSELRRAATGSAIAIGFALPLSTAASNLLLALTIALLALSGAYMEKLRTIMRNPLVLAALGLCTLALLGCAWGGGTWPEKKHYLVKYLALLLIPLLMPLFASPASRRHALQAFVAAMLLTLAISLMSWFGWMGWLPEEIVQRFDIDRTLADVGTHNAVVFKLSITHSVLMSIAAYLLAQGARLAAAAWQRWLLTGLAALAAINVVVMVVGRIGYLTLALAGMSFFAYRHGRRGIALATIVCALAGAAAYQWSDVFHARVHNAIDEAQHWQPGKGDPTSIGTRFDYYSNTLAIIREHPLIGVGTGGFIGAYDGKIRNTAMEPSKNPHNQYLLFAAQYGLPGLAALLCFYALYWRQAARLEAPWGEIARTLLLVYVIGNLFNSFMLDFSERLLFAWLGGVLFAGLPEIGERRSG